MNNEIPAFLASAAQLPSHKFTFENMGTHSGYSYADVYNHKTGRLKEGFRLVGYHKHGNALEVMVETPDFQEIFFHHHEGFKS